MGFCEQPLVFYFRYAMEWAGIPHENVFGEMAAMNSLLGALLIAAWTPCRGCGWT